jgi:hypothetical protein
VSSRLIRLGLPVAACAAVLATGAASTITDAGAATPPQCTGTVIGLSGLSPGPGGIKVAGDTLYKNRFTCRAAFSQFTVRLNKPIRSSFGIFASAGQSDTNFTCRKTSSMTFSCHGLRVAAHELAYANIEASRSCTSPKYTAAVTVGGRTSRLVVSCISAK